MLLLVFALTLFYSVRPLGPLDSLTCLWVSLRESDYVWFVFTTLDSVLYSSQRSGVFSFFLQLLIQNCSTTPLETSCITHLDLRVPPPHNIRKERGSVMWLCLCVCACLYSATCSFHSHPAARHAGEGLLLCTPVFR